MENIRISTHKSELDRELIYNFLHNQARWCKGIPKEIVEKSIQHSLCFGDYIDSRQIGFARMVTDYATFGNLVDVFVVEELRGNGLTAVRRNLGALRAKGLWLLGKTYYFCLALLHW